MFEESQRGHLSCSCSGNWGFMGWNVVGSCIFEEAKMELFVFSGSWRSGFDFAEENLEFVNEKWNLKSGLSVKQPEF